MIVGFADGQKTVILRAITIVDLKRPRIFPARRGLIKAMPIMRITFGNATVKRLESERAIAEQLNH